VTPSLVRPCGGRFVEPSSAVVYCLLPSRPLPVTHHVLVASRATSVAVSKPAVLASTVACGGGHSHPYRPGPGPGSAGRPGRTRLPVTSRPTSVRCRGGLMLRTSGIRCPGSGHRHIDGAEGAPALPQTRVPARVCTGPMHRPERDRGFSANLQAKPPGSRSAAWGRRVAVNTRISHAHGHRRPGKQLRHRDLLRGPRRQLRRPQAARRHRHYDKISRAFLDGHLQVISPGTRSSTTSRCTG
jgi:hypothetical protein